MCASIFFVVWKGQIQSTTKVQLSFKRPSLLHLENDILEIPIGQNRKNWSVRHKTRFWQLVSHKNALALFSNWTAKVPIFNPEVNIY